MDNFQSINKLNLKLEDKNMSSYLFYPFFFIILGLLTTNVKWKFLSKHKLKLNYVFYFISLGIAIHLIFIKLNF